MRRIYQKHKGFTLIELLVTVGIIVILATLIIVNIAQARMSGRDAKRIADVASIQLALEMYKNSKGVYPSTVPTYDYDIWAAAIDSGAAKGDWDNLSTDLKNYLSPLPKDPLNKPGYRYYIWIYRNTTDPAKPISTGAIIKTKLEANEEKMTDDSCISPTNNDNYYEVISGVAGSDNNNHCVDGNPDSYSTLFVLFLIQSKYEAVK